MKKSEDVDFSNKALVKKLEAKHPEYLADAYRRNGRLHECVDLLQKKSKKDLPLEQICLSYIKFKKFKEAEKVLSSIETESKSVSKLKITLELQKNVKEMRINDIAKYLYVQNKIFETMSHDLQVVKFIPMGLNLTNCPFAVDKYPDKFKVYDYKCNTSEYQHIVSTILEYLVKYFDLNLIFIYYEILNISCFLSNCKSNCVETGHKTLMKELVDPSYTSILGYKNLCILYEMYEDDSLLELMYKINPFIDEKYKKLYLKNNKPPKKEHVICPMGNIPIEETVLVSKINKPNGIAKDMFVESRFYKDDVSTTKTKIKKKRKSFFPTALHKRTKK